MPTSVIEHIRRVVGDGLGDGELVGRYVDRRDEAALAALVNRHGPMVWGVCRRLLNHHDAEDAFQATFIVLVRKAASIGQREAVGNWLYGVAHQTALQARRSAARRRAREVQVTEMPDAEAPQERWADLQPLLDEELSRLPDHYRTVIVLSDLEGRTRKEVAAQLGCPEGTVASRLVRARSMLAKRLTKRGVALSGGALSAALCRNASAVPTSVVMSTIKAANLVAAGQAVISSRVAALAEGVLKAMLLNKLKPALAVLVVMAMVGLIGYGVAKGQQNGEPVAPQKQAGEKAEVPVVKEKAEMEDATAWGKEVDGLQAGLLAEAATCRLGDKLEFTVKLRNVGKADIKITHGLLREYPPEVTATDGGKVSVYMPIPKGYKVRVTELTIKPGETITLYNPEVAVESEAMTRLKGLIRVETPTICIAPRKYKIVYSGMIESHPKLTTGTVEFEVKDQVAWGKEADGVQVGILFGEHRAYKVGETVTLTVRLRNNGKKEVPFSYYEEYFQKNPPLITDADGKAVTIKERNIFGIIENSSVAPGKEVDLCKLPLDLRPDTDRKKGESWTLYGTGKFHIQYKDVSVVGEPRLEAPVTTHATGKVELEVKEADKKPAVEKPVEPAAKQEKEKKTFTEWGKEIGGLQAGLGFRPGEKRPYHHGEEAWIVLRLRNIGKAPVEFSHIWAFFVENPPTITDADGKILKLPKLAALGLQGPRDTPIAPGKEVVLYEWNCGLQPIGGISKNLFTIHGTGKFTLQCTRIVGPTTGNPNHPNPTLDKLATGKLELEVKEAEKK